MGFSLANSSLQIGLEAFGSVMLLRTLPFASYAVLGRGQALQMRIVPAAVLLGLGVWLDQAELLVWCLLGLVYYTAVVAGIHWLAQAGGSLRVVEAAALFGLSFGMFLVLPGLLLPGIAAGTFLGFGWTLFLKAYSYAMEPATRNQALRGCLFFFLVDPTIVYTQRGRRDGDSRGLRFALVRGALGSGMLLTGMAVALPARVFLQEWSNAMDVVWSGPLVVANGLLTLLMQYAQQSGLASLQIGLMAAFGYRVAECYRYPLLASSPLDFWRRWNIYLGDWARRYIHVPLAMSLARSRSFSTFGPGLAAVAVFAVIGWLHDAYAWAASGQLTLLMTRFFLFNALLVLLWHLTGNCWERRFGRGPGRFTFAFIFAAAVGAWSQVRG